MPLYDNDLFKNAKQTLESSFGVRQAFDILPAETEILITLDNRIPCTLKLGANGVVLEPHETTRADLHLILFSESIRRFKTTNTEDFTAIAREIFTQTLAGHTKIKLLSSPTELRRKGYLDSLQRLGPEIQKMVTSQAFSLLGRAHGAIDHIKSLFKH